jgi:hypothetical protein
LKYEAITMPHGEVSEIIPASSAAVFELLHDYGRRLEWDTLLQAAYLHDGSEHAEKGAVSTCVGRSALGSMALTTEYVSYDPPRLAAVKMVRGPWLFASWAASIRHEDLPGEQSRIRYTWQFQVRPRGLGWLVGPVVKRIFYWETRKRLRALKKHFSAAHQSSAATS